MSCINVVCLLQISPVVFMHIIPWLSEIFHFVIALFLLIKSRKHPFEVGLAFSKFSFFLQTVVVTNCHVCVLVIYVRHVGVVDVVEGYVGVTFHTAGNNIFTRSILIFRILNSFTEISKLKLNQEKQTFLVIEDKKKTVFRC